MPKKVPNFKAEKDPQRKWHLALAGEKNAKNNLFGHIEFHLKGRKAQNFPKLKFDHFDPLFDEYDRTHRQPLSAKTRAFWNTYACTSGEDICIALMEAINSENPDAVRAIATALEDVIALRKRPRIDRLKERIAMFSAAEEGKPIDEQVLRELLGGEFPNLDPAYFGRIVKKMGTATVKHPKGRPRKSDKTAGK